MWNIEYTYIEKWLDTLDNNTVSMIFAALERLQEEGPNLGRPLVDTLHNSEIKNLKELRPASPKNSEVRIIFAFDPKRSAIMLLGGDKSKGKNNKTKWTEWYKRNMPEAERIFKAHLKRTGGHDGGFE